VVFNESDHAIINCCAAILRKPSAEVLGDREDVLGGIEGPVRSWRAVSTSVPLSLRHDDALLRVEVGITLLIIGPPEWMRNSSPSRCDWRRSNTSGRARSHRVRHSQRGHANHDAGEDQLVLTSTIYFRTTLRSRKTLSANHTQLRSDRHPSEFYDAMGNRFQHRTVGRESCDQSDGTQFLMVVHLGRQEAPVAGRTWS
jgi:hypothetical protein